MQWIKEHRNEESLNAFSHGIGAVLAVFGMILLLSENTSKTEYASVSIVIYSIALIAMFAISAAYHAAKKVTFKKKLRVLDHINIFFLIAGTYSPITLITLVNGNGWTIFYAVWAIALLGTLFKLFYTGKYEFISLLLYVVMGWLIILDFRNLIDSVSVLGVRLLFLGGAFYTFGILFYAWERIPYNHFVWHVFVLCGALSHWSMIYLNVI